MRSKAQYIDPEILKKRNRPKKVSPQKQPVNRELTQQNLQLSEQETQQALLDFPDDGLSEQRKKTPNEPTEEMFGSRRQMQNELKYTAAMKKDKTVKKDAAEEKVNKISERADSVLMKMKTVFPFDFFPSSVIVDANKVTIIDKIFFASETISAILLEEITDVIVESNFFLAKLKIVYSHHPLQPEHYSIPFLKKKEALHAQEIIQGLLVLRISEGIDLSKLEPDEIVKHLKNIGKSHENIPAL